MESFIFLFVHLVGIIRRIYHDARSPEHKKNGMGDTIRQYPILYYNKYKQLHVSAVLRQPSSDRIFQKRKEREIIQL